jgi:Fe-S cluster assembly scaffold protein SufB
VRSWRRLWCAGAAGLRGRWVSDLSTFDIFDGGIPVTTETDVGTELDEYKWGFSKPENYVFKSRKGLSHEIVEEIAELKGEPQWMRDFRHKSLDIFLKKPMPTWGGDLSSIDFDDIYYYIKPTQEAGKTWDDLPAEIKDTFEALGIPEAERKYLAGVGAQYESEVIYHKVREDLERQGVIFVDPSTALREHEELFRKYFSTVIPPNDNKFAALNSAVWSGGSFIYVPKGVRVEIPLQAYFRINAKNMGQFERTLIIADEASYVHYVEGCTAPTYTSDSLHSAVVEIIVLKDARVRYTTIQNWSKNVYNLVTKRATAYEGATMEWVDGNLGCLAEGSTVTTPEGIKPIQAIEVGDRVLSFDERAGQLCYQPVTAKRFSGIQPVHTISVGERKLQVTANHPFYSYIYDAERAKKLGRYQLGYVRADQLEEAIVPRTSLDYGMPHKLSSANLTTEFASLNHYAPALSMSRTRTTRMTAVEHTTDDLLWLFGYWVGDGNIEVAPAKTVGVKRYAKVGFSTPPTDRARDRLVGTMTALVDAVPTERADGHHLAWNSKELAEFFELNGFSGTADTKRVPEWIWSLPESQRLAFIAGYLDADGCVLRGRFSLKSANRELLQDVASLLVTLGITSRLHTEFSEPREVEILGITCIAHGAHRLVFAADPRLLRHVSATLRLQAEADAPTIPQNRQVGRSAIVLPESVEIVDVDVSEPSVEPVPTWDIEVAGTGNFISQGYIVHNSKLTMKYPAVWLMGEHARGEVLSVAFAGTGQHQDAGGKVVHVAPNTSSQIVSKSISKGEGRSSYRGLLKVQKGATNVKSNVRCDALLLDETSRTDTYPYIEIEEEDVEVGHEATVSKVGEEQLFYLMSRGLSEGEAYTMIVSGFIEPIAKELPLEYAVELNRLIQLEMSGSVG